MEEAKALPHGAILLDTQGRRWRVTGRIMTWKRKPNHFLLPLKHGLYDYLHMTENNMQDFRKE